MTVHDSHLDGRYPVSVAGVPVGRCPDCDAALDRTGGAVVCVGCGDRYGLPTGATVLNDACPDSRMPRMHVARGAAFELCIERACELQDDRVRDRFDREWTCPDYDGDLCVLRRGGLIAGCEHYPNCETRFAIPQGVATG